MVVLRAIGAFFAKIGRWIRDTAWVQPLLIVGGIFAIIFSIPSITSWVQSWFKTGEEATAFYTDSDYYQKIDNGDEDGKNSDADKLLNFIFKAEGADREQGYKTYGKKFFVTFVEEDNSGSKTNFKGWQTAIDSWNKAAGFHTVYDTKEEKTVAEAGEFKLYTIFIDKKNDKDKNYFWNLFDEVYGKEFGILASLSNPYSVNRSINYDNIANSGSTDLSGDAHFSAPTTFLFDADFKPTSDDGYTMDLGGIEKYGIAEIMFDIQDKGSSGTNLEKARTIWDCWHHIGKFSSEEETRYVSK